MNTKGGGERGSIQRQNIDSQKIGWRRIKILCTIAEPVVIGTTERSFKISHADILHIKEKKCHYDRSIIV